MIPYDKAWSIPGADGGVLVECGTETRPYWWVLCPATSTLITDPVWIGCSDGECLFDDVHCEAARMIRQRAGRQP